MEAFLSEAAPKVYNHKRAVDKAAELNVYAETITPSIYTTNGVPDTNSYKGVEEDSMGTGLVRFYLIVPHAEAG